MKTWDYSSYIESNLGEKAFFIQFINSLIILFVLIFLSLLNKELPEIIPPAAIKMGVKNSYESKRSLVDLEYGVEDSDDETTVADCWYDVTIWPNRNIVDNIALFYSFAVFLYVIPLVLWGMFSGPKIYPWLIVSTSAIVVILNEALLKPIFKQPRPDKCPNKSSYGMPSGHSAFCGSVLILVLLSNELNLFWKLLSMIANLPVPWARYHNYDHTLLQVTVGFVFGLIFGTFMYFIIQTLLITSS
jgi:PAP2 superfamily